MPSTIKVAVAQSYTLATLTLTLSALRDATERAASEDVSLILFPEAYLGGYPRTCSFGASVGSRSDIGREQFLQYFRSAVDLGDTPAGAGDAWTDRHLPLNRATGTRGDGTREFLEEVSRETGVFIVTGLVERAGGSLYCACVYVDPLRGIIGKRRKVMPTGSERLVWAQGSPSTLQAVTANLRCSSTSASGIRKQNRYSSDSASSLGGGGGGGNAQGVEKRERGEGRGAGGSGGGSTGTVRVTMAAAICWENYMPLLRYALYSQNVNLWLAPTADARDTWVSLMRTVACEGRCFVLSGNQCQKRNQLPSWITGSNTGTNTNTNTKVNDHGSADEEGGHSNISGLLTSPPPPPPKYPYGEAHVGSEDRTPSYASANATRGTSDNSRSTTPTRYAGRSTTPTLYGRSTTPTPNEATRINTNTSTGISTGITAGSGAGITPAAAGPNIADLQAGGEEYVSRGGSCIVSPMGKVLEGPAWEKADVLLIREIDMDDCDRGKLDFDAAGHYSRPDAFKLTVEGLDLSPPP